MTLTGRLEVYIVEAKESICELNLPSLQKGEADATFDAEDMWGQGNYLSDKVVDLLAGKLPPNHVLVVRHSKDT